MSHSSSSSKMNVLPASQRRTDSVFVIFSPIYSISSSPARIGAAAKVPRPWIGDGLNSKNDLGSCSGIRFKKDLARSSVVKPARDLTVAPIRRQRRDVLGSLSGRGGRKLNQHIGRGGQPAADEQAGAQCLVGIRHGCPRGEPGRQEQGEGAGKNRLEAIDQPGLGRGEAPLPAVHDQITAAGAEENQDAKETQRWRGTVGLK